MSKVYKSGKCIYELREECILGEKGVPYDPVSCLTCVLVEYVKLYKKVLKSE